MYCFSETGDGEPTTLTTLTVVYKKKKLEEYYTKGGENIENIYAISDKIVIYYSRRTTKPTKKEENY